MSVGRWVDAVIVSRGAQSGVYFTHFYVNKHSSMHLAKKKRNLARNPS